MNELTNVTNVTGDVVEVVNTGFDNTSLMLIADIVPGKINTNIEMLEKQTKDILVTVENTQYTGDLKRINIQRKEDRSALNKMKNSINTTIKEAKEKYMEPFTNLEARGKKIIESINETSNLIDTQVKEFERRAKAEKKEAILECYEELCKENAIGDFKDLLLEKIYDSKWENASVSMASVKKALAECVKNYTDGMNALQLSLCEDDIKETAITMFKGSLVLTDALMYINKETARRAEEKAREEQRLAAEKERLAREAEQRIAEEKARLAREAEEKKRRLEREAEQRVAEEKERLAREAEQSARERIEQEQVASKAPSVRDMLIDAGTLPATENSDDSKEANADENCVIIKILDKTQLPLAERLLRTSRIKYVIE